MEILRILAAAVIVILVLTILGALVLRLFRINPRDGTTSAPTPTPVTVVLGDTASSPTPTLTAVPQIGQPVATYREFAGDSIVIPYVNIPASGFVAVHTLDEQGQLQRVVVHSVLISANNPRQVQVYLPSRTFARQRLAVVLHKDDGDQIFEYPGPDIPFTVDDNPVVSQLEYVPNSPLTPDP